MARVLAYGVSEPSPEASVSPDHELHPVRPAFRLPLRQPAQESRSA